MDNIEKRSVELLIPYINNPRTHSDEQITQIAASIKEWGFTFPVLIDEQNTIIAGHGRVEAAKKLGFEEVPVIVAKDWQEAKKKAYIIADNKLSDNSGWDNELLKIEMQSLTEFDFDLSLTGFDEQDLKQLTGENLIKDDFYTDKETGSLLKQFMVSPFSVFDARQGYWQERKRYWKEKGFISTKGRGDNLIGYGDQVHIQGTTETSEFDPVLAEVLYRWLTPEDGVVLDPFAGGSVRGIVAACLGRKYTGVDLNEKQIEENKKQSNKLICQEKPIWLCGDSIDIKNLCSDIEADFILSCPPYHDLEKYSNDERDLSNMNYEDFIFNYKEIIKNTVDLLKDNRFACFVVSEIRHTKTKDKGMYKCFVSETINAFKNAGLSFYNDAVLINSAGSLGVRVAQQFKSARKLGRHHQNILVFVKGDPKKATEALGDVAVPDCEDAMYGDVLEPNTGT